ncbi:cyclase family protein [Catellatospora paridis]|uniref:cyclase family protein n=1 Tax=Catellatospora paridis TaxID=1617086 RepID=UPI0012D3B516|nr:cyclase family protein [Catellatospora paridis]
MPIIDLSTAVDAAAWEPEPVIHDVMTPAQGAVHMAEEMALHFGVDFDPSVLPDGELLSVDTLKLTTHTGTHIDAPSHYGSKASYGVPRHIDEMPLDWFHRPAFRLDLRSAPGPTVDADFLDKELARIGYQPQPLDIVLLHTGASAWAGTPRYFTEFTGLDAGATNFLLDKGIRVIGTDAFSLDAPFGAMLKRFNETGDRGVLWPAHFTGRDREFCQIERLANLDALPQPYGFTVSCLPIKIKGAGAGWTRAVAIL